MWGGSLVLLAKPPRFTNELQTFEDPMLQNFGSKPRSSPRARRKEGACVGELCFSYDWFTNEFHAFGPLQTCGGKADVQRCLSPVSAIKQRPHFGGLTKKVIAAIAAWQITRPYTKASLGLGQLGLALFVRAIRVAVSVIRRIEIFAFAMSCHQCDCQVACLPFFFLSHLACHSFRGHAALLVRPFGQCFLSCCV